MNAFGLFRRPKRWGVAQGLVEFAIVLPILLFLIFGIIEFARIFHGWLTVVNAARFGVRYAVTGEYDSTFCVPGIDANGNGLVCGAEPDADARHTEEDRARLPSIYSVTDGMLIGILNDETAIKDEEGYYKITVCSSREGFLYHPMPDDYCDPYDDPGNPEQGPTRVLVAVTYEHPLILPFLKNIIPSVTLHGERTGILEQFRVARVLGLPPLIDVPSPTPPPATDTPIPPTPTETSIPTATFTPTVTPTPTATPPPSCDLVEMTDIYGNADDIYVTGVNNNALPVQIIQTNLNWSKHYDTQVVNEFRLDGWRYYSGDDDSPPTNRSVSPPYSVGATSGVTWTVDFNGVPNSRIVLDSVLTVDWVVDITVDQCNLSSQLHPIYVEIVNPVTSGSVLTSRSQTTFEAIAYDTGLAHNNGNGIRSIRFVIYNPDGTVLRSSTDSTIRYCAYGGSVCNQMGSTQWNGLVNGTYTITAQALGWNGIWSEEVSKTFVILRDTPTPTRTPTVTRTPTPTGTPCPPSVCTPTPTRTATPIATPVPTSTRTPKPTDTPTPTNTQPPANTPTKTPTRTPTRTATSPPSTPVPTNTPTKTPTKTPCPGGGFDC